MKRLQSYVSGKWCEGTETPRPLFNPATEETVAECASGGFTGEELVRHAREKGVPALAELSWAERGAMLKSISKAFHEHRDELLALSTENGGNTRGDAKFDVDGAIGTLAYYAHVGKALPEGRTLPDGDGTQLGRTARWWGEHVWTPRPGLAVHINAFNFPAWGMGEKMACALLAGVPVVEKAGTPSAVLAWRMAQIVVDSGILPEGAFQFVAGGLGDTLDRLGPMDAMAFTGSSGTGAMLKGTANLVKRNVRVNIEADSLNATVVGPEVGDETWDLLLQNLRVDMTQKAGQKCTAVRRILVPEDRLDDLVEGMVDLLGGVQVGDPADENVRMGPLASGRQLEDVQKGIRALGAAGRYACGGPERLFDKGYFVAPTLVVAEDADVDVAHADEVFGPCATVLPYDGDAARAVAVTNRGGGGLVAAVYSDDKAWTCEVVEGIAPWHGRVWIGSEKAAGQATQPGMVLPQSVHGGPGRAGGGEELGGPRGLEFYMQRTAIQGDQALVARRWGGGKGGES